jgi:hypothetical protein
MNLSALSTEFSRVVERVTPYGTMSVRGEGWEGRVDDLDDHCSIELHGISELQLRGILAALSDDPSVEVVTHLRHEASADHNEEGGTTR